MLEALGVQQSAQHEPPLQKGVLQTWGLGECRLRFPLVTECVLSGRHLHSWLPRQLLLKLLQQLLAGLLATSPSVLDALTPAG